MDNLTHTIIGLAVGQAATRLRALRDREAATRLRATLWTVSALANNIPDLDIIYTPITDGRIGGLLHHRGHTHTLVLAPFIAAFLLLAVRLFSPRSMRSAWTRKDWFWIAAVAWLGPVLHIAFDSLNSYGVHPFWPFNSRWFFGDTLFIVEPALWIALVPMLFFEARSRGARFVLGLIAALSLGLCLFTGFVPWQLALLAGLGLVWMLGIALRLPPLSRLSAAWASAIGVLSAFSLSSLHVRARIVETVAHQFPGSHLHDVILTPYPVNPLCWDVITIETTGDSYIARRGTAAAFPMLYGAAQCPELRQPSASATFKLRPVAAPPRPELVWSGQFEAKRRELLTIRNEYCAAAAMLRFLRAPAWIFEKGREKDSVILGDLRFDRSEKLEFAEARFTDNHCPSFVPGWQEPRRDLLGD